MNDYHKRTLKAGINYILEGLSPEDLRITLALLQRYAENDIETLTECLNLWEKAGYLRILKPPEQCHPDENCVEMIQFVEQKSPIRGFLNWQ